MGAVSGGLNPEIFASTGGALLSMGEQVLSSVLPSWEFSIGNFDFSISPSIAIGKGWGFGANVSATFHAGDFSLSAGFGLMHYSSHAGSGLKGWEYRKSVMANYDDGKFGMSLGINFWSGLHEQQTGMIGFRHGDFSMSYENDGKPFSGTLGDGGDSYRTAAASIGIGDFSLGMNLFTGLRDKKSYEIENSGKWDGKEGELGMPVIKNRIHYKYGLVYEKESKYRLGALYIGYKNYRFGINSDRHVRHTFQNRWTHNARFAAQRAFEVIDFNTYKYFQYHTKNKFTSW